MPQARSRRGFPLVLLSSFLFLAQNSPAQQQDGPEAGAALRATLRTCAEIVPDAVRLACFDALASEGLPISAPIEEKPASLTAVEPPEPAAPPANEADDGFGLEPPRIAVAGEEGERVWRVVEARRSDFSGWTLEFENGQVWRQIGTEDFGIEEGERYVLTEGAFDSVFLSSPGFNRRIRVRRLE